MNDRIAFALFLALSWSAVGAQMQNDVSREETSVYRSVHSDSNTVPDGIAFLSLTSTLIAAADDDQDFINAWLAEEMGLSTTESTDLIALFRTTIKDIDAEKQRNFQEIGCITGVPRVYDDDTYTAFEQMDDVNEAVAESYFIRVKNEVGDDTAARIDAWVEARKPNVTYMKHDHKQLSEKIGVGGNERLQKLCQQFYAESQKETGQ